MAAKNALRAEIVSTLRSKGLNGRADWFEHELPEIVDLARNRSLLSTIGVDPAPLTEAADDRQNLGN